MPTTPPTPLTQMKMCCHHTSKKGAFLLSMNGNDKDAKWIPGNMCIPFFINRTTAVVTMPEWLAVKSGFIPMGALAFGGINDKFQDKQAVNPEPVNTNGGTNE